MILKVDQDVAQRHDNVLADLDKSWDDKISSYQPTENLGVSIRYIHLYFRKLLKLGTPLPYPVVPKKRMIQKSLDALQHAWTTNLEGKASIPRNSTEGYDSKLMDDEDIRCLHLMLAELKAACVKKGGWPL